MRRVPTVQQLRQKAPANVVVLPTAPLRQVQQPCNKAGRAARAALRKDQVRHFPHKFPGTREADRRAAVLVELQQTPAVLLAEAILAELDMETRGRVIARLAKRVLSQPGRQAFVLAVTTTLNFGEQWELMNALERAREPGSPVGPHSA
jgi:predicted ABC-type transport system involved in lysophospholipase L1 biosynthesis ATPase subunit